MAPRAKAERFNLRLDETELHMLSSVADALGVSASDVVRMLIREKHRSMFGLPPAPKLKRGKQGGRQ